MRRREFIAAIGGVAAWPLMAHAQDDIRTIGILALGNPNPTRFISDFKGRLAELGYLEGGNVRIGGGCLAPPQAQSSSGSAGRRAREAVRGGAARFLRGAAVGFDCRADEAAALAYPIFRITPTEGVPSFFTMNNK